MTTKCGEMKRWWDVRVRGRYIMSEEAVIVCNVQSEVCKINVSRKCAEWYFMIKQHSSSIKTSSCVGEWVSSNLECEKMMSWSFTEIFEIFEVKKKKYRYFTLSQHPLSTLYHLHNASNLLANYPKRQTIDLKRIVKKGSNYPNTHTQHVLTWNLQISQENCFHFQEIVFVLVISALASASAACTHMKVVFSVSFFFFKSKIYRRITNDPLI